MASQPVTEASQHHDYVHGHEPGYTNGQDYHQHAHFGDDVEANGVGGPSVPVPGPKPHQAYVSQVFDPSFFKIANPGPLGLISFGLTTLALGLFQCGVGLPNADAFGTVGPDQAVFGLAVFFGGAAQFIAGIMEFRVGNTLGCTIHCSYGAFWLAFAMFLIPSLGIQAAYNGNVRAFSVHLGIFLILWCFLTVLFVMASLRTNLAILATLVSLALAFFFLALAQFIMVPHPVNAVRVNRAGGSFSIISALCAFYAGSAGLMRKETTWVRFPIGELPVGYWATRQNLGQEKNKNRVA